MPGQKLLEQKIAAEKNLRGSPHFPPHGILFDQFRPDDFVSAKPVERLGRVRSGNDDGVDPAIRLRTNCSKQVPEVADTAEPFLIAERKNEANADHAFAPRYQAT